MLFVEENMYKIFELIKIIIFQGCCTADENCRIAFKQRKGNSRQKNRLRS